jgi:hypothetical protein
MSRNPYWFRISQDLDILEGRKLPNGSLHLVTMQGEYGMSDIVLEKEMVYELILWLEKAYLRKERNADVIDIFRGKKDPT